MDDIDITPTQASETPAPASAKRGRSKKEPKAEDPATADSKRKSPAKSSKKEPVPESDNEEPRKEDKKTGKVKAEKKASKSEDSKSGKAHAPSTTSSKKRIPVASDDSRATKKAKSQQEEEHAAEQKKKHRWHAGTVALREIKRYQKSIESLTPLAPLEREIRAIAQNFSLNESGIRFTRTAIAALHEARDDYCIELMNSSLLAAVHGRRITIMPKDLRLAMYMRGDKGVKVPEGAVLQ